MIQLPDINEMFPPEEAPVFAKCTQCGNELLVGETILTDGGYPYCDDDCMKLLRVSEGNAAWVVAGE